MYISIIKLYIKNPFQQTKTQSIKVKLIKKNIWLMSFEI
jgi:hypothetical protein